MVQAGYILGFSVQALVGTVVATLTRRLSLYEVVTQTLFIGRVCTRPSLLLMMPIGVFIAGIGGRARGPHRRRRLFRRRRGVHHRRPGRRARVH